MHSSFWEASKATRVSSPASPCSQLPIRAVSPVWSGLIASEHMQCDLAIVSVTHVSSIYLEICGDVAIHWLKYVASVISVVLTVACLMLLYQKLSFGQIGPKVFMDRFQSNTTQPALHSHLIRLTDQGLQIHLPTRSDDVRAESRRKQCASITPVKHAGEILLKYILYLYYIYNVTFLDDVQRWNFKHSPTW